MRIFLRTASAHIDAYHNNPSTDAYDATPIEKATEDLHNAMRNQAMDSAVQSLGQLVLKGEDTKIGDKFIFSFGYIMKITPQKETTEKFILVGTDPYSPECEVIPYDYPEHWDVT